MADLHGGTAIGRMTSIQPAGRDLDAPDARLPVMIDGAGLDTIPAIEEFNKD
jgi:hypothetical protein